MIVQTISLTLVHKAGQQWISSQVDLVNQRDSASNKGLLLNQATTIMYFKEPILDIGNKADLD